MPNSWFAVTSVLGVSAGSAANPRGWFPRHMPPMLTCNDSKRLSDCARAQAMLPFCNCCGAVEGVLGRALAALLAMRVQMTNQRKHFLSGLQHLKHTLVCGEHHGAGLGWQLARHLNAVDSVLARSPLTLMRLMSLGV